MASPGCAFRTVSAVRAVAHPPEAIAMKIGVVFPQLEITADPVAVRDYAQAAEGLGFNHILAYDHVIGADIAERPGWRGPYTHLSLFHEPFVLFGYLAGLTQRI